MGQWNRGVRGLGRGNMKMVASELGYLLSSSSWASSSCPPARTRIAAWHGVWHELSSPKHASPCHKMPFLSCLLYAFAFGHALLSSINLNNMKKKVKILKMAGLKAENWPPSLPHPPLTGLPPPSLCGRMRLGLPSSLHLCSLLFKSST